MSACWSGGRLYYRALDADMCAVFVPDAHVDTAGVRVRRHGDGDAAEARPWASLGDPGALGLPRMRGLG